jgi:hypothetical protein
MMSPDPTPQERRKRGRHIDPIGYDAAKKIKGKKRHVIVDTLGLMLGLDVTPADVQDRDGFLPLLKSDAPVSSGGQKHSGFTSLEHRGQSSTLADEEAVFRQSCPCGGVTFLPRGIDAPRRQIAFELDRVDEPPPTRAFISREVGSAQVLREPEKIRTSALKQMDSRAHRSLLLSRPGRHWKPITSSHPDDAQDLDLCVVKRGPQ